MKLGLAALRALAVVSLLAATAPAQDSQSVLSSFNAIPDASHSVAGLVFDASGNLYGVRGI